MDIVNPYIIDIGEPQGIYRVGDELRFQMVLLGDGVRCAPDLINALAGSDKLYLGAGRKGFELMEVLHGQSLSPVWRKGRLVEECLRPVKLTNGVWGGCYNCSIHLLTPLRIRRNGELLLTVDFPTLIRNITGRMSAIVNRYGGMVNEKEIEKICSISAQVRQNSTGLYLSKVERYSSRRDTKMDLSGLLGAMTFEGDLSIYAPWLNAARTLHIGRNTTFGCGRVDVVFT